MECIDIFRLTYRMFVTSIILYILYIGTRSTTFTCHKKTIFLCFIDIPTHSFLVGKFWYIPAIMKVSEVYRNANRFNKETKMFNIFNNRMFAVSICLTVFISILIGYFFVDFGHHRPAQKILNAEPVKKYNTVTPLKPKNQSSKTPGTITSHSHEEDILEADAPSDQKQSNLRENTDQSRDTSVSPKKRK